MPWTLVLVFRSWFFFQRSIRFPAAHNKHLLALHSADLHLHLPSIHSSSPTTPSCTPLFARTSLLDTSLAGALLDLLQPAGSTSDPCESCQPVLHPGCSPTGPTSLVCSPGQFLFPHGPQSLSCLATGTLPLTVPPVRPAVPSASTVNMDYKQAACSPTWFFLLLPSAQVLSWLPSLHDTCIHMHKCTYVSQSQSFRYLEVEGLWLGKERCCCVSEHEPQMQMCWPAPDSLLCQALHCQKRLFINSFPFFHFMATDGGMSNVSEQNTFFL